jgi:DNA topoisomerase-6 subunit B
MADQESFAFASKAGGGPAARRGPKAAKTARRQGKPTKPGGRKRKPVSGRRRKPAKPGGRKRKPVSGRGPKPAKPAATAQRASSVDRGAGRSRAPAGSRPGSDARSTATDLAKKQRDISVSEFFAKNRHLLGFDNPSKALLTTVKEGVDNSLDACEEAGILPDIRVEIRQVSETRFRVAIEDNGPGIVKSQVPKIFGSLLYGSKFHRLRQSRGQQGIGISAAGMYGLLTTGKPVIITTRIGPNKKAHHMELVIDTKRNEPKVKRDDEIAWDRDYGTRVEIELEGAYWPTPTPGSRTCRPRPRSTGPSTSFRA